MLFLEKKDNTLINMRTVCLWLFFPLFKYYVTGIYFSSGVDYNLLSKMVMAGRELQVRT